jgi:hypothetical protein
LREWYEQKYNVKVDWAAREPVFGIVAAAARLGVSMPALYNWLHGAVPYIDMRILLEQEMGIPLTAWPSTRGFERRDLLKDVSGTRVDHVLVLCRSPRRAQEKQAFFDALCDCGNFFRVGSAVVRYERRLPFVCTRCHKYRTKQYDKLSA